ncbi:MAG: hypothetical protein KAI47_25360, partial [Deltaproteobacteria bacterium]|nr:hypothetical protein [Deltaproteobacteria bacterium]
MHFVTHARGSETTTERLAAAIDDAPESWLRNLFIGLVTYFTEPNASLKTRFLQGSAPILERAREEGYRWLATQYAALFQVFSPDVPRDTTREGATKTLVDIYTPSSSWERALEGLGTLVTTAKRGSDSPTGISQRLRWLIALPHPVAARADSQDWLDALGELHASSSPGEDPVALLEKTSALLEKASACTQDRLPKEPKRAQHLLIEPKLQRRRGTRWTRGSRTSLSKLKKAADAGMLPPEDTQICLHLEDNNYSTNFRFNPGVGLALVGHPRVAWISDESPVEVLRAPPALIVDREGEGLKISLRPKIDPTSSLSD